MDTAARLKQANSRLKSALIRVKIEQMGNKLYLRATLPPRPGATKDYPHQQRIALNAQANADGIRRAEAEAKTVSGLLEMGRFTWDSYVKPDTRTQTDKLTIAQWVEKFERHYFDTRARNPKTETTWKGDYWEVFKRLPSDKPLSEGILRSLALKSKPDTRTRLRYVTALAALANFAGIPHTLKSLTGDYSPRRVSVRELPDDQLIASVREQVKSPSWQWVLGVLATYGLRPHEIFHLNFDAFPTLYVIEGKTDYRHVRPIYPEWAEAWDLGNPKLPSCSGATNQDLGNRVSHAFRRNGIPFRPYDLRHRWAVRSMEYGLDLSLAAAEMGHSAQVHSETYHKWISEDVHDRAFEALISRPDRPKPPGYSQ